MPTVDFSKSDELDELRAKIYLDSGIYLSKKELSEIIFEFGKTDYDKIIEIAKSLRKDGENTIEARKKFIKQFKGCITLDEDDIETPNSKSIWVKNIEAE